jgi:AcrR family transcriptional regulator
MRNPITVHSAPGSSSAGRRGPTSKPRVAARARSAEAGAGPAEAAPDVRARILDTASRLFYQRGVRAVGVDLVVLEAAVAKTSLYRYFPTKDGLIVEIGRAHV